MSRLGAARPKSRKLRWRCEISARPARSSCDHPLRWRHQRSNAANFARRMNTCQVVAETVPGVKMAHCFPVRQETGLGEVGVLIAIVSSGLGGTAAAVTRYLVGNADPVTLAICARDRLSLRAADRTAAAGKWPRRSDWLGVATLGICFFGLFFILYNVAVGYTTAARASLALSTLPLQTMLVGAALGIEPLTARKCVGVWIAVLGVFAALAAGLYRRSAGGWRGEAIMTGAVLCMAFYNVWSRPFIERSSALGFLTLGMGAGAAALVVGLMTNRSEVLASFGPAQWIAGVYLGVGGGALAFILWVLALQRATPTRVATTMTVNPIAAPPAGHPTGRRADHAQPGHRIGRRIRRHLDRYNRRRRPGSLSGCIDCPCTARIVSSL